MTKTPFALRVIWQPEIELGLLNDKGKADHAKIMGYFAFMNFMALAWFQRLPPLGTTIVLNATIYGWVGMRTYLNTKKGMHHAHVPPEGGPVKDQPPADGGPPPGD